MKPTPLVPAPAAPRGGPRWSLAASALLHALLLLAALSFVVKPPPMGGAAPSYDLVFQGPNGGGQPTPNTPIQTQTLPPAQPADVPAPPDAVPGIPAPTPLTTPDPAATGSPPPSAVDSPPPAPQPPTPAASPAPVPAPTPAPQPALTSAAPPRVADAPPDQPATLPLPMPAEPPTRTADAPAVRLELPPTEAAPAAQAPIMPEPPPPLPPIEAPRPTPRTVPRPSPRATLGTLSNPMDLSLAPSAPRPAARGSVASRAIDLSPPSERQGPLRSDPYANIRAANASADWNRGLLQYWLQHRYYPEEAASKGDEGQVTIQLTVNRSGKVEDVEILSRSGSYWLDMAAVSTWRNAQLPPFTNEMREDRITFPIPIRYYLIRR